MRYVGMLIKKGLLPTREMIRHFSSEIAKRQLGERWIDRFIKRNSIHLISEWTTGIDRNHYQVNSAIKHRLYFNLFYSKIREYNISSCHTYNMDEKGFLIGVTNRSKRVFTRRYYDKKEVGASLQGC
jgi:hypothetical protein